MVDDRSTDDTVQLAKGARAHIVASANLAKGASMPNGLVSDLDRPLVSGEADFVKARF